MKYENKYRFIGTIVSINDKEIVARDSIQRTENFFSEPKFCFTKKTLSKKNSLQLHIGECVGIVFEVKGFPPKNNYGRYNKLMIMNIAVKRNGEWYV